MARGESARRDAYEESHAANPNGHQADRYAHQFQQPARRDDDAGKSAADVAAISSNDHGNIKFAIKRVRGLQPDDECSGKSACVELRESE